MRDQEEQSLKDTKELEKRATSEAGRLAKKQERRKSDLAREEAIGKGLKARKAKESERRVTEEAGRLAKRQETRKSDLAREEAIGKGLKARKAK